MLRVNDELFKAEEVAIWTKEELHKQNAKLMVIDEQLNKIDSVTERLKKATIRLRRAIVTDKLHCFCVIMIILNFILLCVLLFTTIGGDKKLQDYIKIFD